MKIVFTFNLPYLGNDFDFRCEDWCLASLAFLTVLQQNFAQVQGSVNGIFKQSPMHFFFNQSIFTQEQNMLWLNGKQQQD
jgi:hypothetical protein